MNLKDFKLWHCEEYVLQNVKIEDRGIPWFKGCRKKKWKVRFLVRCVRVAVCGHFLVVSIQLLKVCSHLLVVFGGLWSFSGDLWSFLVGCWWFAVVCDRLLAVCGCLWFFASGLLVVCGRLWLMPVLVTTNIKFGHI